MIKHILADGRELKDITGHEVKRGKRTEAAYRVLTEITERGSRDGRAQRNIQAHYGRA